MAAAEVTREGEGAGRHVDRDDLRAGRDGDLHRRQPHAAAAVHRDVLPWTHATLLHHRAERRREAAAQRRGGRERQLVRQRHQVDVGLLQRDQAGERAPVGEPRLRLRGAHLVVADGALRAAAARADERDGDAVADRPAPHARAHGSDGAGELVPRDVRQPHVAVVALPAVPVAAAHAGRADLHDDAVRRGRRVGDLDDVERTAELLEDERPHPVWSCSMSCRAASVTEPDSDG